MDSAVLLTFDTNKKEEEKNYALPDCMLHVTAACTAAPENPSEASSLSLQRHLSPAAKLLRAESVEPEGVSRPCVLSLPLSQHRSVSLQQELGGGEWGGK